MSHSALHFFLLPSHTLCQPNIPKYYFYHASHLPPKCYRFQFLISSISQRLLVFALPLTEVLPFFKQPKAPNRQVSTSAANTTSSPFPKLCSLALQIWLHAISNHFLNHLSYMECYKQQSGNTETERSPGIQGKPGYIVSSRPARATDWKLSQKNNWLIKVS